MKMCTHGLSRGVGVGKGLSWRGILPIPIPISMSLSTSSSSSSSPVSMVQGASRGIGLQFTKQLLEKHPGDVVATCRKPESAEGLIALKDKHGDRLKVLPLDVTNESTIQMVAKEIQERYGRLDLLVNSSGALHIADKIQPETSLSRVDSKALLLLYEINAVGPTIVTKNMWQLLKNGGGRGTGRPAAVVANLSARVSSISDNYLGGWHSYRASKTALNQLTKTIAVEFARRKDPIICILLHPGTVDTDLSKPFQRNVAPGKLFTTEYTVEKLLGLIDRVDKPDNGKLFAWDGQEIPW